MKHKYSPVFALTYLSLFINIIIITLITIFILNYTQYLESLNIPVLEEFDLLKIGTLIAVVSLSSIVFNIIAVVVNFIYNAKNYFTTLDHLDLSSLENTLKTIKNIHHFDNTGYLGSKIKYLLETYYQFSLQNKEQLKNKKELIQTLLENYPMPVLVCEYSNNLTFNMMSFNQSFLKLLKIENSPSPTGKNITSFFSTDFAKELHLQVEALEQKQESLEFQESEHSFKLPLTLENNEFTTHCIPIFLQREKKTRKLSQLILILKNPS